MPSAEQNMLPIEYSFPSSRRTSFPLGGAGSAAGLGWSSAAATDEAARRIALLAATVHRFMPHPHWLHDRTICNLCVLGKCACSACGPVSPAASIGLLDL